MRAETWKWCNDDTMCFFWYSHTFSKKFHQKWTYRQQFPLSRLLMAIEMCCFSKYPYCLHSGFFFYPAASLKLFQFSFILSIKKFGPQDPTFVLSTYRHWDVLCTKGNSVTELVIQSTLPCFWVGIPVYLVLIVSFIYYWLKYQSRELLSTLLLGWNPSLSSFNGKFHLLLTEVSVQGAPVSLACWVGIPV